MNNRRYTTIVTFLMIIMIISWILALSSPCSPDTDLSPSKKEYTFALVPQGPPEAMQKNWMPFIDQLARDTGLVLKLKLYEKMTDFEDSLKEGAADFAYLNPVQEIMAWNARGYIPLVRSKNMIAGSIVVRKDSGIRGLSDLDGKDIVLVGQKNVCSIVLSNDMKKMNVTRKYAGSSSNVMRLVAIGEAAAGGTLDVAFAKDGSENKQELHPIYTTEPLNSHPIAAHPSVAEAVRGLITDTILSYAEHKDTQSLLECVGMQGPVAADYGRDYKPLEERLKGKAIDGKP